MSTFGWAWLAATAAFAIHVADEATHDFLAWYNPRAMRLRQALGGFPFPPSFTFVPWLTGLVIATVLLAALVPAAFAGARSLQPIAYVLAVVHVGNGLLHVGGSLVVRRPVPGVLSAPLLLASGCWLASAAAHLR